jgi:hypothetical protein
VKRIPTVVLIIACVAFWGCAPKSEQPSPAPVSEVKATTLKPPIPEGVVSMNYINAASALAADDFDKAKASLTALANESTGELKTKAQAAADAPQLAAMRDAFKDVSAIATEMQLPPDYAVALCPMYKGGARWVQKKDTLANPYFGKAMLTCGSFVKS